MKIVLNKCYGGYSLSPKATLRCWELGMQGIATPVAEYYGAKGPGEDLAKWRGQLANPNDRESWFMSVFTPDEAFVLNQRPDNRTDPILVRVVEEMGDAANGSCAKLRVIEIPDGEAYEIDEYDGIERVGPPRNDWG